MSLPSLKLTISLISIYKHYTIDIANPSSMQEAWTKANAKSCKARSPSQLFFTMSRNT